MRVRLGELLVEAGVINDDELQMALEQQGQTGRPLGKILIEMEALDEETLTRTLARQLSLPVVLLRGKRIRRDVLDLVPAELIEKHGCLPVQLDRRGQATLMLAMHDPSDIAAIDEVALRSELPVKPVLAAPSDLEDAILRHAPADPGDSLACAEFVNGDEDGPNVLSMQQITPAPYSPDSTSRSLPPLGLDEKRRLAADAAGSLPVAPPALEAVAATEAPPAAEAPPAPETSPAAEAPPAPETSPAAEAPPAPETSPAAEAPPAPETSPAAEAPPAPETSPAAEAPPAPETSPAPTRNDLVLRAITQLLVEKGILSRDELIDRLGALKESDANTLDEG